MTLRQRITAQLRSYPRGVAIPVRQIRLGLSANVADRNSILAELHAMHGAGLTGRVRLDGAWGWFLTDRGRAT